ncbi:MAG: beta strand repeat-containing protein [Planctomycetota bacterium]
MVASTLVITLLAAAGCTTTLVVAAPTGADDSYSSLGNTTLTVSAANGVLANDTGSGTTVSASDTTSANGATVAVNADGSFTYTPLFGVRTSPDTFDYTVSNSGGTSTATVTITLAGLAWYIDNSGANGDGSQATPFNSIANFYAASVDQANDVIVLAGDTGTGYTTASFVLSNGQQLVSDEADVVVGDVTVATATGTRATLDRGVSAVQLASDNVVRGIDIIVGSGHAFVDAGNIGNTTISDVAISGTGGAISISAAGAGTAITLDSLTMTGGTPTSGIELDNFAGSFSVTGSTTINNTSLHAIDIETSSGSVTLGAVSVSGHLDAAIRLLTNTGTIAFGVCTLGAPGDLAGVNNDTVSIVDCSDVTFGNMTIADADRHALNIVHSSGSLTFGDVTISAQPGGHGLSLSQTGGTVVAGNLTVRTSNSIADAGLNLSGLGLDFTAGDVTAVAGASSVMITGAGTVGLGDVTTNHRVRVLAVGGAGAIDVTVGALAIDSAADGLVLENGDGTDSFTMTGAGSINAHGNALTIDGFRVDDGAGNGIDFDTIATDGSAGATNGMLLRRLQDDLTINTSTTLGGPLRGLRVDQQGSAAPATVTFNGTTAFGTVGTPIRTACGILGEDLATLVFHDLSIVQNSLSAPCVSIESAIVEFSGAPVEVTCAAEVSLYLCTSPNGGSDTWTFGTVVNNGGTFDGIAGVLGFEDCKANVVITGDVTATNFTDDYDGVLFLIDHVGNVTFDGNVSATGAAGTDMNLVYVEGLDGDVDFNGSLTLAGPAGANSCGINVLDHIAGNITFNGAVSISGFTGANCCGVLLQGSVPFVFNSDFTISGLTGAGSDGIRTLAGGLAPGQLISGSAAVLTISDVANDGIHLNTWRTSTQPSLDLQGSATIETNSGHAIWISKASNQTYNLGDVAIDCTTDGQAIVVDQSLAATITFGNLDIDCPNTVGFHAIDLRGSADRSNAGTSFSINADDGTSGIRYPTNDGNGTAIFSDGLASLSINGAAGNLYSISEVGTGTTDGGDAGFATGPHAIFARDCGALTLTCTRIANTGELATDGNETVVVSTNSTDGFPATGITITDCEFSENPDGNAIQIDGLVSDYAPTIDISRNVFGSVTNQAAGSYACWIEISAEDGAPLANVSMDLTMTGNTFTGFAGGGLYLRVLDGVGASTIARAQIGGTGAGQNTFTDIGGTCVEVRCENSRLLAELENAVMEDTGPDVETGAAVVVQHYADDPASTFDFNADQVEISGYNHGDRVRVFSEGLATDAEFRFAWSNGSFTDAGGFATFFISIANQSFDSGAESGVFDLTLGSNDMANGRVFQDFDTDNASLIRMLIFDNSNLPEINLDRDSGVGPDRLVISDMGTHAVADPASNPQITAVLTDPAGNNNTNGGGVSVITDAGDPAATILQSGANPVALPTQP